MSSAVKSKVKVQNLLSDSKSLYKSLLKVQKRWPAEPTRPGRNLKDFLHKRIESSFSEITDPILLEKGKKELKALQTLLDNKYQKQFGMPQSFQPVHRSAYDLLSTDAQKNQKKITPAALAIPVLQSWISYKWREWTGKLLQQ